MLSLILKMLSHPTSKSIRLTIHFSLSYFNRCLSIVIVDIEQHWDRKGKLPSEAMLLLNRMI